MQNYLHQFKVPLLPSNTNLNVEKKVGSFRRNFTSNLLGLKIQSTCLQPSCLALSFTRFLGVLFFFFSTGFNISEELNYCAEKGYFNSCYSNYCCNVFSYHKHKHFIAELWFDWRSTVSLTLCWAVCIHDCVLCNHKGWKKFKERKGK